MFFFQFLKYVNFNIEIYMLYYLMCHNLAKVLNDGFRTTSWYLSPKNKSLSINTDYNSDDIL